MPEPSRTRIFTGIAFLTAGLATLLYFRQNPTGVSERQQATRKLGEYLGSAVRPKGVLVVGNPFAKLPNRPAEVYKFEAAAIAGLKAGLGSSVPVIAGAPAIKPEVLQNPGSVAVDPNSSTPLSFMIEAAAFDELIRSQPSCDTVVSLIGVPVNLQSSQTWNTSGPPRFALLLPDWRIIGNSDEILAAFYSGKLAAAAVVDPRGPASPDQRQYLLVNSNNIAELLHSAPQLFSR